MGRISYEFRIEMSEALYKSYVAVLSSGECRTQSDAVERARMSGAPHFFTSGKNCWEVLHKTFPGPPEGLKNPDKIRKFQELHRRALRWKEEHDMWPGLFRVCNIIVNEPAPEYYICHNTAMQIIRYERKKQREEIAKRWVR